MRTHIGCEVGNLVGPSLGQPNIFGILEAPGTLTMQRHISANHSCSYTAILALKTLFAFAICPWSGLKTGIKEHS